MSSPLKLSGPLKVGSLAAAPSNPENGLIYYDTTSNTFEQYKNGGWKTVSDEDTIAALTAANIAFAKADGSKKNIQAASDDVEAALGDLDEAMGPLAATPTNYTPGDATKVSSHLAGIDSALLSAGGTEFADDAFRVKGSVDASKKVAIEVDGLTTSTLRTITMPDSDVDLSDIASNNAKVSADGLVTTHSDVTGAGSGIIISAAERTKLSNIEALADVTDSVNVDSAGAVMESDVSSASMSFVIDEDAMGSNSATKIPTQQSVKAYVDSEISSAVATGMDFKGDYNATTNVPDLDVTPIAAAIGDTYVVNVAGVFFSANVEIGDKLMAKQASPTLESHWSIVQANLDAASIKTQYESNANSNEFSDAEQSKLAAISGTNTGDEAAASDTVSGIVELATIVETDAGTDSVRAVTPAGLVNIQADVDANSAKVSYSAATAKADVVNDSIIDGNLDTAPSENAVFDALALKADASALGISNVVEDITPQLGGDLDLNGSSIEDASNDVNLYPLDSVIRAKQASKTDFITEEYIHNITLSAALTDVVMPALTFAHASFNGLEIVYRIKESTSNKIRIGTIRVVTNGTDIVLNDIATETGDMGVSFSAVVSGLDVNIRYSSGTYSATLRVDAKFFKA